jgi:DNA-binding beta-propeller fold protein YncE
MALKQTGAIAIPGAMGSSFDHGAFDPNTRRIFVAHTGRDSIEVLDPDGGSHIATLPGFAEAAGVVADAGQVLVTNRGAARLAWLDAQTLKTHAVFQTGEHPNGVAIVAKRGLAIVASIGDDGRGAKLEVFNRAGRHCAMDLPGRPRWCVTDRAGERVFLAIRDPSMVLVASLPDLTGIEQFSLPVAGAHGLDIDHDSGRLYIACDDRALVEVDIDSGVATRQWPLAGPPDVTFFNPVTKLVHVATGEPGLIDSIDPRTGRGERTQTGAGAHTTALVAPDTLYVFSPLHGGALAFKEA